MVKYKLALKSIFLVTELKSTCPQLYKACLKGFTLMEVFISVLE